MIGKVITEKDKKIFCKQNSTISIIIGLPTGYNCLHRNQFFIRMGAKAYDREN